MVDGFGDTLVQCASLVGDKGILEDGEHIREALTPDADGPRAICRYSNVASRIRRDVD